MSDRQMHTQKLRQYFAKLITKLNGHRMISSNACSAVLFDTLVCINVMLIVITEVNNKKIFY